MLTARSTHPNRQETPVRSKIIAAATALLATLLAGCGGGSDADTLRVGTEGTYSPFSFQGPGGELTGYDVEVVQAVGAKLGKQVEFVQTPWDAIFAGLEAERFDLVANQVTINDERKAKYDLSEPYTVSEGVIVTRADNTDITSLADLRGRTTAQSATSNWATVARDAGANVEAVEGFVQAVQLLKDGRVDATVNDTLAVAEYQKVRADAGVKIAGTTGDTSQQAFAARKDSGLIADVNRALGELRADGTLKQISEKYFGTDVSGP
jgi:cystine transport system substrate-binding protein